MACFAKLYLNLQKERYTNKFFLRQHDILVKTGACFKLYQQFHLYPERRLDLFSPVKVDLKGKFSMDHRKKLTNILLLCITCLIVSCAQLPEYAQPRLYNRQNDDHVRNGFRYRQLVVEDFQAKSLPHDYRQFNHSINAQSCISIQPSKNSKIHIVQSYYKDKLLYFGTVSHLVFEAIFDPDCSWWNPKLDKRRKEYVIQHEQVHFALAELAARKLTREAGEEVKNFLAIGENFGEIQKELIEKLNSMRRKAMEESTKEHTEFDQDTSLSYNPQMQAKWLKNVNIRLAQ